MNIKSKLFFFFGWWKDDNTFYLTFDFFFTVILSLNFNEFKSIWRERERKWCVRILIRWMGERMHNLEESMDFYANLVEPYNDTCASRLSLAFCFRAQDKHPKMIDGSTLWHMTYTCKSSNVFIGWTCSNCCVTFFLLFVTWPREKSIQKTAQWPISHWIQWIQVCQKSQSIHTHKVNNKTVFCASFRPILPSFCWLCDTWIKHKTSEKSTKEFMKNSTIEGHAHTHKMPEK